MIKVYCGFLSFFLPGLGQVFEGRLLVGMLFFICFVLMVFLSFPGGLPLLVLSASVEAFYRAEEVPLRNRPREILFGLVGLVGLFAWASLLLPFSPT